MPPKKIKKEVEVKKEEEVEEEVEVKKEMDVEEEGSEEGNDIEGNVFYLLGDVKGNEAKTLKKDIESKGGKLYARMTSKVNWVILADLSSEATVTKAIKIHETDKSVQNFITLSALTTALTSDRKFTSDEKKAATDLFNSTLNSNDNEDKDIKQEEDNDDEEDTKQPAKKRAKKDNDDDDEEEKDTKEAGKKVVVKGKAAVDEYVPGGDTMVVYQEPDSVWDCMLNQTNIAGNNNKFYKIQLLVKEGTTQYFSWNRWGRVGERGQNKLAPMLTLDRAKADFKKKFLDKTKNHWENRANFVSHPGKYTLLEIDYNPDEDDDDKKEDNDTKKSTGGEDENDDKKKKEEVKSKLDKRLQDLIKLIFDMKMMESILTSEYEFDAKKQPLGKLTKKQIKDGYGVLQEIEKELGKGARQATLMELSSRFYTLIPHCFGRMRPPVIDSSEKLKKKMKMLENLADIEIAVKLIKNAAEDEEKEREQLAQVDLNYRSLKAELVPLEKDDEEFKLIKKYVENTHPRCTPEIKCVFRLKREGEHDRFVPKMPLGNRKLLWHGSRLTNVNFFNFYVFYMNYF